MHVITILSTKGGSSRSTTAVNLAVEASRNGKRTAIIDLDPQCSSTTWGDSREAPMPVVTSVTAARLAKALAVARDDRLDLVLVDTAPHSADAAVLAASKADLLLVPVRPAVFDLRSLTATAQIVRIATHDRPAPAYVILSQAQRSPRQLADAKEAIRQTGLDVCPVVIHQRVAFSHASMVGLAASEWEPCGKAAEEIAALWTWADEILGERLKPNLRASRAQHNF